jgi:uncharacterized protein (DUF433 family)
MELTATHTLDPGASTSLADMIVKTPGTCGGRARIAGTRIKVEHIYNWVERQRMTPAEVVKEYPHLTMAQVHVALAYYWSHQDEIQRDIAEGEKLVAGLKAKAGPSKLHEKLIEPHAKDDPVSPG